MLDSVAYATAAEHDAPAGYSTLLAKVIDRVEVFKERVVIVPVVGRPHEVMRP